MLLRYCDYCDGAVASGFECKVKFTGRGRYELVPNKAEKLSIHVNQTLVIRMCW